MQAYACTLELSQVMKLFVFLQIFSSVSERALATLYVGMGPVFSVFGGFDTPETHTRHVQNLILIVEMESAS